MTARYVNINTITRKLKGRLKLYNSDEFYPVETVDETLIDEIIEEKEDYVDLILGQIYTLPLQNPQPTIKNIVENLVMADLLEYCSTTPGEMSNLGVSLKRSAMTLLFQLTAGTNIVIPGADTGNYIPGVNVRRLMLQGEVEKSETPKTTLVNSDSMLSTLTDDTNNTEFINDDYWDNPFSMDWYNDSFKQV
jgi:hypothetical protein